ncbi:GNAT family N-acetyltransferase [Marinobacter sp. SS5-14b]|uniref:GNAT family N-acetyltransferase n=1 Tax=Marinobacter sp. SS5-14b TaxID=3050456 RepID=UPI0026DF4D8A|nr:GNAT family protein [Marinobacter sp. SS5-14b]
MTEFYLRELKHSDAKKINEWRNSADLIDLLGAPFRYISESVDEDWIINYYRNRANCVRLAICSRLDDDIVGAVYLLNIDWISRRCEFAIWIGEPQARGRGIGRYATVSALKHAFNDLNLNSVYLDVLERNEVAKSLYEKVGFRVDGVRRQAVYKNGEYLSLINMSILKAEF